MIIIRRILSAPSFIRPILQTRFLYNFSDVSKIKQLHESLIAQSHKLKAKNSIKLMSKIHKASLKIEEKSLITKSELEQVLSNLSSEIQTLGHEDLTVLLQVMSQIHPFNVFDRRIPFMKILMRRLNNIHMMDLKTEYKFKFMYLLDKMEFPSNIIRKYFKSVQIEGYDKNWSSMDVLRFFVCALDQNSIPPQSIYKFYCSQIKPLKIEKPSQMLYLHQIYKILESSFKSKIAYQTQRQKFNNLAMNPYSQQHNENKQQNIKQLKKQETQNQVQFQGLEKLKQECNAYIMTIKREIDLQKLKADICRIYDFQKYPLTHASAVMLADFEELRDVIYQFFIDKFKVMGLTQFGVLVKVVPAEEKIKVFEQYRERAWKHFNTSQKIRFLNLYHKHCNIAPTKQQIISTIPTDGQISIHEYQLMCVAASKFLSEHDQLETLKIVEDTLKLNEDN